MAVQFAQPVVDLEVLAAFAAAVKDEFPHREQHAPLPPMVEDFGVPSGPTFQLQFGDQFMLPRSWFVSRDGSHVIQLQGDRVVLNWRRTGDDAPYPRYDGLRPMLDAHLGRLLKLVQAAGGPEPTINFCEVTYVNQIRLPGTEPGPPHPDLAEALALVRPADECDFRFLPRGTEDETFHARFRIASRRDQTQPGGRLYLSAAPVFAVEDQRPLFLLNLSAHVLPDEPTFSSAWDALDVGHEWVVRGFKDVTTARMHAVWEEEAASS